MVVHDAGGLRAAEAWAACYRLLPAVHRLWRKIPGEEDDYFVTPKVGMGNLENLPHSGVEGAAAALGWEYHA